MHKIISVNYNLVYFFLKKSTQKERIFLFPFSLIPLFLVVFFLGEGGYATREDKKRYINKFFSKKSVKNYNLIYFSYKSDFFGEKK